jgi:hypothetical protein
VQHLPPSLDAPLSVPSRHRVLFTRDAFGAGNAALRTVMTGAGEPGRAIAFVDDGVLRAHPALPEAMRAHFALPGMPALLALETVPGGEACKRSMEVPDRVIEAV